MKNFYILSIIALLLFFGCSKNEETVLLDHALTYASLEKVSDQYLEAWNNKDMKTLDKLTSDAGVYYGSDPDEIMDKNALMEMYALFFEDETNSYLYSVDTRKIRFSPDGKSGIIYERIIFEEWSPNMPLCQTTHLIKINGKWKIDFISWGFIIRNDDVEEINKHL